MNIKSQLQEFLHDTKEILLTCVTDISRTVILLVKSQVDNLFLRCFNDDCLCEFQVNLKDIIEIEEEELQLTLITNQGYITLEKS